MCPSAHGGYVRNAPQFQACHLGSTHKDSIQPSGKGATDDAGTHEEERGKTDGSHLPTAFLQRLIRCIIVALAIFFPDKYNFSEKIFRPSGLLKLTNPICTKNVKAGILLIFHSTD